MPKELPSPDLLRKLLRYEPDTGKLYWRHRPNGRPQWNARYSGTEAFTVCNNGYMKGSIFNKMYRAHRVIWAIVAGCWPTREIDHIDHDPSNNRWENLRETNRGENMRNACRAKNNTTGITGVTIDKRNGRYIAQMHIKDKHIHLGSFETLEEAANARKNANAKHNFHDNHGTPTSADIMAMCADKKETE